MHITDMIPPLSAIRAFEASARLMSFTKAAAELGMTQAAVSYQIKLLEERLGTPLFLRKPRALALSEAGGRLAGPTSEAFDILRDAYSRFTDREQQTLIVNTMHTFAAQWLAPRLGMYQLAHPKTAIQLETTTRVVDFAREEVDVVIRSGKGKWQGLVAYKLIDVRYTLMVSPALAARVGGLAAVEDMFKIDLLDPHDDWWLAWFNACRQPMSRLNMQLAPIGLQTITASAAMAGLGGALLVPEFFQQEIRDGRLVAPFDILIDTGSAYWLAFPEARRNVPKIKAFRDWILDEIKAAPAAR